MGIAYEILTMRETDGTVSFERNIIPADNIPEKIDGENGRHICHVSALTGLIARRLIKITDKYALTEADISKITLASSLHDIGKSRIPRAILDKKGALTPGEYDIVKRHTIFGAEIIERYGDSLDAGVKTYAKDIALHHHERYDGTGYPHGLQGDDISIWAQIVSIADAYEAITAERPYKKAISNDVALDMISNGMCGVFNPLLVECLIQVTNQNQLERVRSKVISSRAVHVDPNAQEPHNVLLLGNLRYITQQFLSDTFPDAHVTLIGKPAVKLARNVKIYDIDMSHYREIIGAYDFDFIIYFANELTYDTADHSDTAELRQVMMATQYISDSAKFLYLSSLDAAFEGTSDRGIISAAKENICTFWAEQNHPNSKIVRIPYLYSGIAKGDYLYSLFEDIRLRRSIQFQESESSNTYFLSMSDLSDLIVRLVDSWTPGYGILTINDDFKLTFGELSRGLATLADGVAFEFKAATAPRQLNQKNTAVKQLYGWFARISILTDLQDQYDAYLANVAPKVTWRDKLNDCLRRQSWVIKTAELILMFVVCELLAFLTDSTLVFSIVDFRLAYIVIAATLYGLPYGMGAATLCSISWIFAKVASGTGWMTLFYEPSNWIAFIFYFLVGALCGYVKLKKDDTIKFTQEENRLLEAKLAFTRQIYEDTFNEKRDLKKQILSSKDSFGKIFDITRRLNTVDYRELYLKIVDSFEEILENKTISVYSVNRDTGFARLEVASRDIMDDVSRSISLDTYAPVMDVLYRGDVWRNNQFIPNMPMFACGVSKDDKLLLLVFIWNAQAHQRSLYYVNLFRIMCDLTQMSLTRAHEYSQTMYEKQHIGGTIMLNAEAFRANLSVFEDLAERKVFKFLPLQVARGARSDEELGALISKCIRANDVVGKLENGDVWILLSQAGPGDLQFILPRFEKQGISIHPESVRAIVGSTAQVKA